MFDEKLLPSLRFYCIGLGFIVGTLVQLATLGANFLLMVALEPAIDNKNRIMYHAMGVVWALLSALMVALFVLLQSNLFTHILSNKMNCPRQHVCDNVGYLATIFVLGDFLGIYSTLVAMDAVLGAFKTGKCLLFWFAAIVWSVLVYHYIESGRLNSAETKKHADDENRYQETRDLVKTVTMV